MVAGRPREFDPEKALDKALHVFWVKGYEGASMPDLTEAMGINRPSLYAAFGNKEELFRKALDRYSEKAAHFLDSCMSEPTARTSVEKYLRGVVDANACGASPKGCLMVQAALSGGDDAKCIREELAKRRGMSEQHLQKRFERGQAEGDIPKNANAIALARFYATVLQGISVQAAGGADTEKLHQIADIALEAWPR